MANEDVKFRVGAEDTGVDAVLSRIGSQFSEFAETMKGRFEGLVGAIEKVNIAMTAMQNALRGGELFKEAVEATVNMTKESQLLGRQLGISSTDASILKVALGESFATQEQWSAGASKITQTLNKNEAAFKSLGVATRDNNGDLRNAQDIQLDVNEKLMQFAEGSARNSEAVKIYGRSWKEIEPTFRVNNEAIKEAAKNARELGLVVGQESVAQSDAYRKAMVGVHDSLDGVFVVIGNALLPALTSMAEWFREIAPTAINVCKAAFETIYTVLSDVKLSIVTWVDIVVGSFTIVVAHVERVIDTMRALKTGNWDEIQAAWEKGTKGIEKAQSDMTENLKSEQDEAAKNLDAFRDRMANNQTAIKKPTGGKGSGPEEDKDKLAALKQGIDAEKAAYAESEREKGEFIEFSKQQEIDYWQRVLDSKKLGTKDAAKVQDELNKLLYARDKEAYQDELAALKERQSAYKNNLQAKLEIAKEYAAKVAAAEGGDGAKAHQAGAEVLAIEREIDAQKLELAKATQAAITKTQLSGVDAEEQAAKLRVAQGAETKEELLAQQQEFEARRLAIIVGGINAEIAAAQDNPEENAKLLEQLNAQKIAAASKYQAQMSALAVKAATDQEKVWSGVTKSMESGFTSVFSNFMNGTKSLGQTIRGLVGAVAQSFEQMAAKNISTMLAQAAMGKTIKMKELMGSAGVAAGNAYKAIVGIPYVGPFLAPAAAAVAYAGVMAFGSGVSAEGGYDIPAGVNPVVQTHQREMILPQEHADTIRNLAQGSARNGSHVTMQGASMGNFFMIHKKELTGAFKQLNAQFAFR
jgi:hypothetical protein